MQRHWTRRDFLATTALGAVAASTNFSGFASAANAAQAAGKTYKTQLHNAFIVNGINAAELEGLAKAGAEGVETTAWDVDVAKAREGRKIAEEVGIKIHSVMRAWTDFNQADKAKADIETVKRALRSAAAYGASAILLVPCRIGNPGPAPWDFDIEYDPATLQVSKVCKGDNSAYAEYIKLQNEATDATYRCMEELIPVAAYEGVTIGLENVWNNLWCGPKFFADFVKSFHNVWVKAYFDMGNHAKYAKTEDWLAALGKDSIVKLHIKDFKVDKEKPMGGDFVPIGKGSVDWQSVRDSIEAIGYDGFVTIESGGYTNEAHVQVLNDFFAGKKISVEPNA